jgi:hypothetical protein
MTVDINKLLHHARILIEKNGFQDLKNIPLSRSDRENFWLMLSNEYGGNYDFNQAKLLKKYVVINKNGFFDELYRASSIRVPNAQNF